VRTFDGVLKSEKKHRCSFEELVFSIDNKSTQAMDDAFSITVLPGDIYRVHIHISDVASLVTTNTAIDKEASVRAQSTYVMKAFHLSMLPHDLNGHICSLVQG
jgi:exoribonuclease R